MTAPPGHLTSLPSVDDMRENITMLTLNIGLEMPALGLGVFQTARRDAAPVEAVLSAGYRTSTLRPRTQRVWGR